MIPLLDLAVSKASLSWGRGFLTQHHHCNQIVSTVLSLYFQTRYYLRDHLVNSDLKIDGPWNNLYSKLVCSLHHICSGDRHISGGVRGSVGG